MEKVLKAVEGFVSFKEKVYQSLRQTILSGALRPGEVLIERELAERLGVSRTPVREALHKLEEEGLVSRDAWRGSIVAIPTPADAEEVLYIRMALELIAIDLAADNLTRDNIRQMREFFSPFADHENMTGKKYKQYIEADKKFHRMIVELCKKPRIIREYKQWQDLTHWYRLLHEPRREQISRSIKEHAKIIDCLEAHDLEGAKRYMREHVSHAADKYRKGLSEQRERFRIKANLKS
jgi:DNA-binding GntR family transcriptional regulator